MNWNELNSNADLDQIKRISSDHPVIIYKHSTRCSISSMALNRLERSWNNQELPAHSLYFLDLIRYRELSNNIEIAFGVRHESPQILVISDGKCVHHSSHMGISYKEIREIVQGAALVG